MTYSDVMAAHSMPGSRLPCQCRPEWIRLSRIHAMPDRPDSGHCSWEGRRLMRTASILSLICVAAALTGCARHGVEFVASNPESVLLDFPANPPGEMIAANDMATQQCQIYSPRS